VLDEPTNHLDLEAIHALAEALKEYEGTILFVSHDRWFVSEVGTRILEVTREGPRDFPGTYAEYLERCGDDHLDADAVVLKAKDVRRAEEGPAAAAAAEQGASWEEQKKRRNRLNALPARRDKLLAQIEVAEARKGEIAQKYAEPGFFQRAQKDEVEALEAENADLGKKIEAWMTEWEEIETELSKK
jgi:energy-coupling factor transporter ATP-binding protein EcfA2